MHFFSLKRKRLIILKIFLFLCLFFLSPIPIIYTYLKHSYILDIKKTIALNISSIKKDLAYKNNTWNLNLYNDDPDTPSPSSNSTYPLYIITTDGYIIERSSPVAGVLDISDFKHLLEYQTPQFAKTPTNERWRVFSRPIINHGNPLAVIVTAYYDPSNADTNEIDKQLILANDRIKEGVIVRNGSVQFTNLEKRKIPYEISYEVVNSLNSVLLQNGKVPSFIDVSYVGVELKNTQRIVKDKNTGDDFLLLTVPLLDNKGLPIGVLVVGRSLARMFLILHSYLLFSLILNLIFIIPLSFLIFYILRFDILKIKNLDKQLEGFARIYYNKDLSIIEMDNKKIHIPYASNQYYLCKAVFSMPKKQWEVDELLEKFGEEEMSGKSRKIYDAMLAVNKKAGIRLIIFSNKTYKLNPNFLAKLHRYESSHVTHK